MKTLFLRKPKTVLAAFLKAFSDEYPEEPLWEPCIVSLPPDGNVLDAKRCGDMILVKNPGNLHIENGYSIYPKDKDWVILPEDLKKKFLKQDNVLLEDLKKIKSDKTEKFKRDFIYDLEEDLTEIHY